MNKRARVFGIWTVDLVYWPGKLRQESGLLPAGPFSLAGGFTYHTLSLSYLSSPADLQGNFYANAYISSLDPAWTGCPPTKPGDAGSNPAGCIFALVAQSVERLSDKQDVGGSSPPGCIPEKNSLINW
jgi:hypothetical protein